MSKPEVTCTGGIYVLTWEDQQLRIRIDRLREDSRYQVTGEMLVQSLQSEPPGHLHQARLNLTSTTARRTLARHLLEVTREEETDWGAIVEQACVETLDAYRQGEPIVDLKDVGPRQTARHRLYPLLIEGHPNMIFGYGGAGKSYLGCFFSVLISAGLEYCGLTPTPGRVLYLDYETSAVDLKERITMIENGLDRPGCSDILYRFCCQPLAAEVDDLQRHVTDQGIEFIVVDSLAMACGGDPSKPEFITPYFRALRSLKVTSLTLHHKAKVQATSNSSGPYGSVYIQNYTRSLWELKAVVEPGEPVVQMGLFHLKSNFGPLLKPFGFSAHFRDADVLFNPSDVREVPELAQGLGLKERIKGVLRYSGAITVAGLAEELEVGASTIRTVLNRHKGKAFVQLGDGKEPQWGLLETRETT